MSTATMQYSNYRRVCIGKLGVQLEGWPEGVEMMSPSNMKTGAVAVVQMLYDRIQTGELKWVDADPEERQAVLAEFKEFKRGDVKKVLMSKPKAKISGSRKRQTPESEDEVEETPSDHDDEDEESPPPTSKKRKRPADKEDEEEDAEDQDPTPKKAKSVAPVAIAATAAPSKQAGKEAAGKDKEKRSRKSEEERKETKKEKKEKKRKRETADDAEDQPPSKHARLKPLPLAKKTPKSVAFIEDSDVEQGATGASKKSGGTKPTASSSKAIGDADGVGYDDDDDEGLSPAVLQARQKRQEDKDRAAAIHAKNAEEMAKKRAAGMGSKGRKPKRKSKSLKEIDEDPNASFEEDG